MPAPLPPRHALALAALSVLLHLPAHAQQQTIVITGNPLGRDTSTQPSSVLSGNGLSERRAGTLGETLDGLPGVSASGFGPNASRPVIRGLDGDRIRLLDNGGASIDASNLSFDHASASDPLVAERIEVLRGPAALLYGGNATGGVVNSIDNRIPKLPAAGLSGRAEVRLGGAAAERSGAALLEGGQGAWAWHADAYGRQAADLRAPRYTPREADGTLLDPSTRVRNSAARSEGGAVGGGYVSSTGYLGASIETTRNRYGTTAEPDVAIHMQRDRLAVAGEWRALPGLLQQVSAQASRTRYRHEEVDGTGAVGTTFLSTGDELRLQARHAPIGPVHGVWGLQVEGLDFSALGEEAFVPATQTRSQALFALEELPLGAWVLSAGGRQESVHVQSAGDAGSQTPRFGAASGHRFSPASASVSVRSAATQGWQASATLGHTERAPAYYELYANGLHVATAAYEQGDTTLGPERSRHAELGLAYAAGDSSVRASVFDTRFARFISLDATGAVAALPDGGSAPAYAFRAARARLRGVELEGRTPLPSPGPFKLVLSGGLDSVRGDNLDTAEPLPRLAPLRLRAGLQAEGGGWRAGLNLRHSATQSRVPATDSATPGATLLDLWADGDMPGFDGASWFARVNNLGDRLAYNAAAIATVRGLSPQAGRALTVGLRVRY
jgi:iron complex outermembrane receptor protein